MRIALILLSSLLVAQSSFSAQPNVLIIQTDEHNFRTLGCYRKLLPPEQAFIWGEGVKVDTPNIDSIAERGAICTRYYATSPVCTPSRAALMTGVYPQNTGSISNDLPMLDSMETFAAVLGANGYATGYAGKWHLDGPAKPGWAPARKFGFEDNRYMFNRGHWKKLGEDASGPKVAATDKKGTPNYDVADADDKSFTTDFLADRTIEFINKNKEKPFCFMVSIPDPHGPNTVRAPYDTMFDPKPFQQPKSALTKGDQLPSFASIMQDRFVARQMALYFGMVKCIDDNIGRILATLRQNGQLENTILVFTSDHGDMCGEHGRYNKGIPCEGSARIPFVIAAPGMIQPGTVINEALGTVDFKPTLLSLLGVEAKAAMQGRDASALLKSGKAPEGWVDQAFVRIGGTAREGAASSGGAGWLATFTKRHKLILSPTDDPALFDLDSDPFEMKNLFHDPAQRELIRTLAKGLEGYLTTRNDPHAKSPAVMADLAWCLSDATDYTAPKRDKTKRGKAERDE
ncbi:sulfatase [Prosthecobacter sp.]|uniref:sulfatase family protein n=1 Tax=Prosthecobacter sp. TaxID=1965333 RepID=UPI001DADBDDE|nr:sulfatase [Prosthecobacter sp.]MCB1278654.1 sulfatase [Prosthecobacter sp.]